jgi:hypothetical protein
MPNPYVSSVVTVFPFVLSVKNCWFGCVQPVNNSARFSPAFSLDHGRFCAWDDTSDRKSVQNGSNRPHLRLVLHYRRRSDIAYCAFWTGSGPGLTRVSLSLSLSCKASVRCNIRSTRMLPFPSKPRSSSFLCERTRIERSLGGKRHWLPTS